MGGGEEEDERAGAGAGAGAGGGTGRRTSEELRLEDGKGSEEEDAEEQGIEVAGRQEEI